MPSLSIMDSLNLQRIFVATQLRFKIFCAFQDRARADGVRLGAKGGVNGSCYAWMIENEVIPVVKATYSGQFKEIFQDDCAVIHRQHSFLEFNFSCEWAIVSHVLSGQKFIFDFRCNEALEACRGFADRIPHDVQAAKMADVWPVENLWGILNQRVKKREPDTKEQLRRYIEEEWSRIDDDKAMCRRLMESIPKRLQVNMSFCFFTVIGQPLSP